MLRRLKSEVLPELPLKTVDIVTVDIDAKAMKACEAYLEKFGGLDAVMEKLGKGLSFETMATVRSVLASAKIPAMLEYVEQYEEADEPVVVFSAHRAPIDQLAKRRGWEVITGDTPNKKRDDIVDAFQRGDLKGVGCTIKAAGVGITLTRAAYMLFVDREFTPALNWQAEDRISRIGQERPHFIKILAADHPLDVRLSELLSKKKDLIEASVDAARDIPVDATENNGDDHAQD
jgi:SWI/SNF-related matrix-associated actin-dependent regulator 1 of chromatin subfamily A